MRTDFVNEVARALNISRRDLIEKDIILHQVLTDLSQDSFFSKNFVFKGGTCLIKSYFGYVRFSEDIDFTWKDQDAFSKMSGMKIRLHLSKDIDKVGQVFEQIAKERGLDFKCVKSNPQYVQLGGSDRTCTFRVWYASDILKQRTFFKTQINFVEQMCFTPKNGQLSGLLTGKDGDLDSLFPEESTEYARKILFAVYDIREILCEKVRAAYKARNQSTRFRRRVPNSKLVWNNPGRIQEMHNCQDRFLA